MQSREKGTQRTGMTDFYRFQRLGSCINTYNLYKFIEANLQEPGSDWGQVKNDWNQIEAQASIQLNVLYVYTQQVKPSFGVHSCNISYWLEEARCQEEQTPQLGEPGARVGTHAMFKSIYIVTTAILVSELSWKQNVMNIKAR